MPGPVRVAIVDDHPLFRYAVEHVLTTYPGVELVAAYASGSEAIHALSVSRPDVVLVDLSLPDMDGFELITRLTADPTCPRAVVLSGDDRGSSVHRAVRVGAAGYLTKDVTPDRLVTAVTIAASGGIVLPRTLHTALAEAIRQDPGSEIPTLAERERQVLRLLAEGASVGAIAQDLFVSRSTAKASLSRLYGILGVSNRAAAIAEAARLGLLKL